jgi:hypothetical protein
MMARTSVLRLFAGAALLLAACSLLYEVSGGDIIAGWPGVAIENWKEYGLRTLKGQLVVNPGGFEAITKPEIYTGHRPLSLYPVLAVEKLCSWGGTSMLPFHLAFSLALFISIGMLLGGSGRAWLIAAAALLSPGYTLYPGQCDPNAMALYMLLPVAAWVLPALAKPSLPPLKVCAMAVLILAYTCLNWTTVFGHGMLVAYLLASRNVPRRRLVAYVCLTAAVMAMVTGASILDKLHGGPGRLGSNGDLKALLAYYLWGSTAYGGMTTGKAFLRLFAANVAGLLPLGLICGYFVVKRRWNSAGLQSESPERRQAETTHGPQSLWLTLLPLFTALAAIVLMRNYFGNHPWMAASTLLPGSVLSLRLMFNVGNAEPAPEKLVTGGMVLRRSVFVAACMAYALMIMFLHRAYHTGTMDLVAMVRNHTARSDTIVVVRSLDPKLADANHDLADSSDRRVVVVDSLSNLTEVPERAFMVSTTGTDGKLPALARTACRGLFCAPVIEDLFALYARRVARRNPSALRFVFQGGTVFYLYPCSREATYAKGH